MATSWQEHVERIVRRLEVEPGIEGAFLGGSLVTGREDEFSDIDLGVVTGNRPEDLQQAFSLRQGLAAVIGEPELHLERRWEHSLMIALLYGPGRFPPIGFELDLFFGQLQHLSELMPGARFRVVFDRAGRLRPALEALSRARLEGEVRSELLEQMQACPFDLYHAAKAQARGDLFNYQSVMERVRSAICAAAAGRAGTVIRGCKWAGRYLSPAEREAVQRSYHEFEPETIRRLAGIYLLLLAEIQHRYGIEGEVQRLQRVLSRVLAPIPPPP